MNTCEVMWVSMVLITCVRFCEFSLGAAVMHCCAWRSNFMWCSWFNVVLLDCVALATAVLCGFPYNCMSQIWNSNAVMIVLELNRGYLFNEAWFLPWTQNQITNTNTKKKLKTTKKNTYKNTYQKNVNNANCTHFRIKFEGEHCWLTQKQTIPYKN